MEQSVPEDPNEESTVETPGPPTPSDPSLFAASAGEPPTVADPPTSAEPLTLAAPWLLAPPPDGVSEPPTAPARRPGGSGRCHR